MSTSTMHLCAAREIELAQAGMPATKIELMPIGAFELVGRDGKTTTQSGTLTDADAVIKHSMEQATAGMLPIDFDHSFERKDVTQGVAAGWITALSAEGDRIMAEVEWSSAGREALMGKTYRFVSPVFMVEDQTGHVRQIVRAALTNLPALPMLKQVASQADPAPSGDPELSVDARLTSLLAEALGLDATAGPDAIVAALVKRLDANTSAPPQSVPAEAVATFVATQALERQNEDNARKVTAAMQAGKLPPAMEQWGHDLVKSNPEAFDAFVASSPLALGPVFGLDGRPEDTGQAGPNSGTAAASIEMQLGLPEGSLS